MTEILLLIIALVVIMIFYFVEHYVEIKRIQDRCHEHMNGICLTEIDKYCKNCPYKTITYSTSSKKENK